MDAGTEPGGGGGVDGGPTGSPGVCVQLPTAPSSSGLEFVGDPEFDDEGNQVAWQEFSGRLFVASLDPQTGLFVGAPSVIASDVAPLDRTYNGAEWAFSQQGAQLVYTWNVQRTFGVAVASKSPQGVWSVRRVAGRDGIYNPRAKPLIQFLTGASSFVAWSTLDDNAPATIIDNSTDGHWAEGDLLLTYIDRTSKQVMLHDPMNPTRVLQLTNDDNSAKQRPYLWRAPEFGGRRMLFARVGNDVRFYLERANAPLVFDPYRTVSSPSPAPYNVIASPEPTVRSGRSYLSFMASSTTLETDNVPAQIWLMPVALDGGAPIQVSEPGALVRTDPEPFDGVGPMFAYYTRVDAPASGLLSASTLKLFRCTTGL
jgi:hypothetical protein